MLREKGWNTFWLGKNHYGFIGGETNQWYPTLVEDNHYIEQPYQPEDGYHLSKELADKGIGFIRDSKQSHPDKPWFMWFCPVANHAPHHAPLPEGKVIEGDAVRPWDTLSDGEKRLFARMAEVYAGYSKYTDHQVGRIVDYLEESGQLDNTLIVYCADNGASDEGSPSGSVNENKFFNAWPDDIEQNLTMLDKLGGPDAYNHYPTGWAAAFSTPFRMFKRYSYQGGVSDPLVIHWPKGIQTKGEVREQYHHCTDIVPTILDCCGVEFPDFVQGYEQTPLPGVSMRYSFDDADAPTTKRVQYYEMMGTRGLWNEGWKVVAERGPLIGTGNYENDRWQLFHTDEDRSEAHDHR